MIINRQRKVRIDARALDVFVSRLRKSLRLGQSEFNICLVSDAEIARLNGAYRKKNRPTDVLSFPWDSGVASAAGHPARRAVTANHHGRGLSHHAAEAEGREFAHFLGDIVISAETARRNARAEGHAVAREIRWLVLHGVLHLLGYDHEADAGEMNAFELSLRDRLKI